MEWTTRQCCCDARLTAQERKTFAFEWRWGAWVSTETPVRSMSRATEYWAFIDRSDTDHKDHRGEPYLYHECPWCHQWLPHVAIEKVQISDAQIHEHETGPLPVKGYRRQPSSGDGPE